MVFVNCPTCGKQIEWSESEYRPFCTEKCKLLDLGEWIEEGYRLPDESSQLSEEDMQKIESSLNDNENDELS